MRTVPIQIYELWVERCNKHKLYDEFFCANLPRIETTSVVRKGDRKCFLVSLHKRVVSKCRFTFRSFFPNSGDGKPCG